MKYTASVVLCLLVMDPLIAAEQQIERPDSWAQPLQMEGVPNLFRVNDRLYRSAQPNATGMQNLKALGIETIINLRSFHSDRDEIGSTGLGYEHIYMKAWHPEQKEVVRFLQLVTNEKRTPVLVHCKHGADRTGTMCAIYRIVIEDWSKADAIREMTEGGYAFNEVWYNLPEWIDKLDIEAVKLAAGIETPVRAKKP
ncbi:MAG: tyrosine-protein phosphatase [Planctomycetaceae bacterium]|nr:tyrosine-protein phosphatase [Planctomycetaceae bacterium]